MKNSLSQVTYTMLSLNLSVNKSARLTCSPINCFFFANPSPAVVITRGLIPSWPLGCSVCGESLGRSLRWPSRRSLGGQGGWCWGQCRPSCWQLCRSLSWESGRCWGQFCHGEIAFKMLVLSASFVVAFDKRRERGLPRDQGAACLRSPLQAH